MKQNTKIISKELRILEILKKRKKKIKNKKDKQETNLTANFVYNEKVAKSFHNMEYFASEQNRLNNLVPIEEMKKEMTTKAKENVTEILNYYQNLAEKEEIKIFKVLQNIRNKNITSLKKGELLPNHNDLLSIVANPYMLVAAYRTIRKNKGSMTKASFIPYNEYLKLSTEEKILMQKLYEAPDGINMNFFHQISTLIKGNCYPWGCSRLIWIPKPGTTKERPITIPPFSDRIVQESIRMVLESIYEPLLQKMDCSFGFRASNGVHQAIIRITDDNLTSGLDKAIEGDIESAYPNLNREILLKVLGERIKDKKFLSFMKKRLHLRLFDTKDKNYKQTYLGIPQGGIDSPYLWNIYLLGLDQFIKNDISNYIEKINEKRLKTNSNIPGNKGKIKQSARNPIYNKLDRIISRLRKKIKLEKKETIFKLQKDLKKFLHKKRNVRYYDPQRIKLRFLYLRYADDWIIITNAPTDVLKEIKRKIAFWLKEERAAILSEEKTLITDMRKNYAHFLGFQFKNTSSRRLKKTIQNGKKVVKRTAGWTIIAQPDQQRLINRLYMKGYCDKKGFPREIPWLARFDANTIVQKYNSVISGFTNFYAEYVTFKSSLNRWIYIYRWSAIKTLAQKHQTKIKKIFEKYGKEITTKTICKIPNKKSYEKITTLLTEKQAITDAFKIRNTKKLRE